MTFKNIIAGETHTYGKVGTFIEVQRLNFFRNNEFIIFLECTFVYICKDNRLNPSVSVE